MKAHGSHPATRQKTGIRVSPREFVFVDRKTGKKRFAVKPCGHGTLPLEEMSSLLAMHCVLRSQTPSDFRVMVAVGKGFMERIAPRTRRLIKAYSPQIMPIQITARQHEVLRGVFQNRSNKEIAAEMHVSERTVKFHVSALLEKFRVTTRLGLAERLSDMISSGELGNGLLQKQFRAQPVRASAPGPLPASSTWPSASRANAKLPA